MNLSRQTGGDILVLGLGNSLRGDDGLGVLSAELLDERKLPAGVCVKEAGTPGWGLPAWLEGWRKVILIDAADMGLPPGSWRRFGPEGIRLLSSQGILSLHEPGLADGLALAEALELLPEEVVFYCIEPATLDGTWVISQAVDSALLTMVDQIYDELWKNEV